MKEFDSMLDKSIKRGGSEDICKIFNIMDEHNLKPNEDELEIDKLDLEARNTQDYHYEWKTLKWNCRNCDNSVYSANNPNYNCGESNFNWCHCGNTDTYFDKEGMLKGMRHRKQFGTDFLDRGVWNL